MEKSKMWVRTFLMDCGRIFRVNGGYDIGRRETGST